MATEETSIDVGLWRKSRRSIGNGACVEIASASGAVAVRDSTDRVGPVLHYSAHSWQAFIVDAKIGTFDVIR
jgi:uncharacterized protein DUF397